MTMHRFGLGFVAAAALAFGLSSFALAQGGPPPGPGPGGPMMRRMVFGKISAVTPTGFTVTNQFNNTSTDVVYSGDTRFRLMHMQHVDSLRRGEHVQVMGRVDPSSYTVTAFMIMAGAPMGGPRGPRAGAARPGGPGGPGGRFGGPRGIAGTITEVSPLTVTAPDGAKYSVETTADTRVMRAESVGRRAVIAGRYAMVMPVGGPAAAAGPGPVTARMVTISTQAPRFGRGGPGRGGRGGRGGFGGPQPGGA